MEIKEINEVLEQAIADLANKDEMEAEDGMNIVEDIDAENELADMKSKKRYYDAAFNAIEELRASLEEGIDPATGTLDPETEEFHKQLGEISAEIYSRGLAFEV